jgi:branched-chain amino acid transport system ATP-binding protein
VLGSPRNLRGASRSASRVKWRSGSPNPVDHETTSLVVDKLCIAYGGLEVVTDVCFEVDDGEVLVILGRNGAGKTTTARTLAGLVTPKSGEIFFCGESIGGMSSWDVARKGLAFVSEAGGVFPTLSVTENLKMWFRHGGEGSASIEAAFELFPALAHRRKQVAGTLSGGEQRMLSLARVLIERPPLVVVDEPSLGLAPSLIEEVYRVLEMAKSNRTTLVIIEQFAEKALAIASKALVLDRGRVVWSGPANEVSTERLSEAYLGGAAEPYV